MVTFATNTEKIEFLNNIVIELEKNIYADCFKLGIDATTLDTATYNSEEFLSSFPENMHFAEHVAKKNIDRNMTNLITVNKKLDELNND